MGREGRESVVSCASVLCECGVGEVGDVLSVGRGVEAKMSATRGSASN